MAKPNDRVQLVDDNHRLLIETEHCSIVITPAYLGPLVIWVEEDPLRPCGDLALLGVGLSGKAIGEPLTFVIHSDKSLDGSFPFTFDGAAQIDFNINWSGVSNSERLFKAEIEIQVDNKPIQVLFRAASIEPKWLIAKPYWKREAQ